ncbi:MAG: four helix bundle protein [Verrucomicrobiae bacterium]|nr:four helix bundle protein [Verrucomicrobiae bacterium]MCB1092031.1 four helix bundle protein [Verrucomicrobiae bacterium]
MSNVRSYRDLLVWNMGMDLAVELYGLTQSFPADEKFGLTAQVRKAAVSVPSNIAEGHARGFTGDYVRFLRIGKGSLAEMETQIMLAERLDYIDGDRTQPFLERTNELGRMLNGLIAKLTPES